MLITVLQSIKSTLMIKINVYLKKSLAGKRGKQNSGLTDQNVDFPLIIVTK